MDSEFGYWFSGFVDGEGCFLIQKGNRNTYHCRFTLNLRDDDLPILELIHTTLGFGVLTHQRKPGGNSKPQSQWRCNSKADCLSLVEYLENYPLRAKKLEDFRVWSQAVKWWNRQSGVGLDWSVMASYMHDLREVRSYKGRDPKVKEQYESQHS